MAMRAKPDLKPGAYARIEELEQATEEYRVWKARWARLILECRAYGWTAKEIAEAAGITDTSVYDRWSRKVL